MIYKIVPKDYSTEIEADSAEEAMEEFATFMDLDMGNYFRAIPASQYDRFSIYTSMCLELKSADAKTHCQNAHISLEDYEYELLAKAFLDKYDCNVSENDLWDYIIDNRSVFLT